MKHAFTSAKSDSADPTIVSKNEWNDVHVHGIVAVSADTVLDATHDFVEATSGAGDITVTLPALASAAVGRPYEVMKVDPGAGRVVVKGSGAELINDSNTWELVSQWQYVKVVRNSAGTVWMVRGSN